NGSGKTYERYRCRTCKTYWRSSEIHEGMKSLFSQFVLTDEARQEIVRALDIVWAQNEVQVKEDMERLQQSISKLRAEITKQVEAAIDPSNELLKDDILLIIDRKKEEVANLQNKLVKLSGAREHDKKEFLEFALSLISDTSKHYLEEYVSKENRLRCKQLVFPSKILVNDRGKVYTHEISPLYRLVTRKKSTEVLNSSHLVRVKRL
ncbi:MAG TPA: hypothetical protein VG992_01415, partial [Candidatus Saccharimonadales bacterium]|nr:hypothetical protein [Candidatus Saccharimonadales bacterium]